MKRFMFFVMIRWVAAMAGAWVAGAAIAAQALEPVPDKLVVLTFDDSVASHYSVVRPLLKQYNFSATFFITEGFSFPTNKTDYMTWEQIAELHRDGFEIGNHTRDHLSVTAANLPRLAEQIEAINQRCQEYGIPRPTSFAYPGNAIAPEALRPLRQLGIRFARRGGAPEHPYEGGRGVAFTPAVDHPLLIPSAGDARPYWTVEDFQRAVRQAHDGRIAVLQFHGVPDRDHPWVNTPSQLFAQYMKYLHEQGYKVIAVRDLARYVDADRMPAEPLAAIQKRQEQRSEMLVRGEVVDEATGQPLPARLYIQGEDGAWHFPYPASSQGSAVRYQRRSGFNTNAVEMHTTLSAHPFGLELPPGRYTFTVERGKEYFPETRDVTVGREPVQLRFALRRWIDMAKVSWYSGDTHVHRDPAELPNVMLAEDVNVVFPMVYWTTDADVAPSQSNRGFKGDFPAAPVTVDATHVYYPRNTEYEIFTTAKRQHTLGALLLLNHKTPFDLPVLPVTKVAARARAEGALLDLEKHNWPWSMALVPLLRPDFYELANNHLWRTEYGVTNWALPAPAWMEIGSGGTTERAWALYGLLNYYALLDCGFRLRPTAGTANGVHPVPLGFGRVYVHLEGEFQYDDWLRGLNEGRSFVTTGPMLFVTVNGRLPGHIFGPASPKERTKHHRVEGTALSPQPLRSIEIVVNGEVVETITPANRKTNTGAHESLFSKAVKIEESSWVAVRCFEKRPHGRLSFAHTAPFYIDVPDKPLRPRREEIEFLLQRVNEEIVRNQAVLPAAALEEYRQAQAAYAEIAKTAR